jgi:hypothetical protein
MGHIDPVQLEIGVKVVEALAATVATVAGLAKGAIWVKSVHRRRSKP